MMNEKHVTFATDAADEHALDKAPLLPKKVALEQHEAPVTSWYTAAKKNLKLEAGGIFITALNVWLFPSVSTSILKTTGLVEGSLALMSAFILAGFNNTEPSFTNRIKILRHQIPAFFLISLFPVANLVVDALGGPTCTNGCLAAGVSPQLLQHLYWLVIVPTGIEFILSGLSGKLDFKKRTLELIPTLSLAPMFSGLSAISENLINATGSSAATISRSIICTVYFNHLLYTATDLGKKLSERLFPHHFRLGIALITAFNLCAYGLTVGNCLPLLELTQQIVRNISGGGLVASLGAMWLSSFFIKPKNDVSGAQQSLEASDALALA